MENFLILSAVVALSHQTSLVFTDSEYTTLNPSSVAYTKVTNTVQPLLSNCQCIVLTSSSQPHLTPELAQHIIQRAAHLGRPLQIHSYSFSIRLQSYAISKHEAVELVLLYVPPIGPSNGILHWEYPLNFEGNPYLVYLFPYLLIYLVDDSYLKNTKWSDKKYRACHILPNIVYLQFWSLQPDQPVYKYALQYRCDGYSFCMPMLESVTADEPLGYKLVMEELRMQRSNFHRHRIAVESPGYRLERWIEVHSMHGSPYITLRDVSLGRHSTKVPVFHLAQSLNLSMNFYAGWSADGKECNIGFVQFHARRAGGEVCIPGFLEFQLQDFLLQSSEAEKNLPLAFLSVLSPMRWNVWLLLGLVTLLVWVQEAFKTQCKESYVWLLVMVAYFCGQYFEPGKAPRLWCTFWVVVMFFVSNFYSAELQSLQIVPPVELKKGSFDGLNERNATYLASFDTYIRFRQYAKSRPLTAFMSEKALRQLTHVASVLQPMPYNLATDDLWQAMKNTSIVWFAQDYEAQTYCDIFVHRLGVSCQKLKFDFLATASWTMTFVPHGDVLVEKYRFLTDAGIVHYWGRKASQELAADSKRRFLKLLDFSDDQENSVVEPASVGFSDSVLEESFYLYALSIGISLVSISVEMIFSNLGFYWKTVQNRA